MNKSDHGPMHAQVAAELRRRIAKGVYPIDGLVPSEATLTAEFEVSRGTMRQALAALRSEGLIGGGQGKPPVVRSASLAQPFETFLSFTSWAEQAGRVPGQRTIEVARRGADPRAADALDVEEGDPVVEVLRLRLLDGMPAMLERSAFVEDIGRLLFDIDTDKTSIYASLTELGVDLYTGRHTFDAVAADDTDARLLEVTPGSPLLRERRRASTRDGRPLEYGDDRYLPNLVSFTIVNTRQQGTATAWQRTIAG
ncbi:MAG: GntR family transcriptional regulator [Nocardioides sp.]|nr:GntR family transcriptional regulator [Nocardioides sp.]